MCWACLSLSPPASSSQGASNDGWWKSYLCQIYAGILIGLWKWLCFINKLFDSPLLPLLQLAGMKPAWVALHHSADTLWLQHPSFWGWQPRDVTSLGTPRRGAAGWSGVWSNTCSQCAGGSAGLLPPAGERWPGTALHGVRLFIRVPRLLQLINSSLAANC